MRGPNIFHGILFCAMIGAISAAPASASHIGKKFPNFTGKDFISGKNLSLEDFRGQVVLVDFWATWCGPCVAEIPNVKSAYDQFKDQGLVIISISLDSDKAKCKKFIGSRGMDWHHIVDGGGWGTRLAKKYNINSIPKMFLIDRDGVCVSDSVRGGRLAPEIEKTLKKPAAAPPVKERNNASEPSDEPKASEPRPAVEGPADLRAALDPVRVRQMQDQIGQVGRTLQEAMSVLRPFTKRMDAAVELIPAIESELPAPTRGASTRDLYLKLRTQIIELRHELFMLGLLNERPLGIPDDPFVGVALSEQRPFFQAKAQLPAATAILDRMKQVVGLNWDALALNRSQLASLSSELDDGRGGADALQIRCQTLCDQAKCHGERWTRAWQIQLEQLHEVVAHMSAPAAPLKGRCDEIDQSLATLREEIGRRPSSEADLTQVREHFAAISAAVKDLAPQARAQGSTKPIKLPSNPFERRSLYDRLLLPEVEVQMRVAQEAVQEVRKAAASSGDPAKQHIQTLMPRIQALQSEMAAGKLDARGLAAVREKYALLCQEILAAADH